MPTPDQARLDRWLYGGAGALALFAGAIAIANACGEEDAAQPEATETETEGRAPQTPTTGGVIFGDAGPPPNARVGPDFVPDLPRVPDLETEPPRPREQPADPRMEQLGAEMRILSHARELLTEHPAEALGVLETHRRRYPRGVLREERDAFVIETLLALEHVDEAERRYYDFLTHYPDSDFRERLRQAMQRAPHEVGASGR